MNPVNPERFALFIAQMTALVRADASNACIAGPGRDLLQGLVSQDDWLPTAFAQSDPVRYRHYLLHLDPETRFCAVSFVWGPGQGTPIHDHTVWGLVGVLRGGEREQRFRRLPDGRLASDGQARALMPGDVGVLLPDEGDIHQVSNLYPDCTSVSVHIYGADIAATERSVYELSGARRSFAMQYANALAAPLERER